MCGGGGCTLMDGGQGGGCGIAWYMGVQWLGIVNGGKSQLCVCFTLMSTQPGMVLTWIRSSPLQVDDLIFI
jgi:hypothetical protein